MGWDAESSSEHVRILLINEPHYINNSLHLVRKYARIYSPQMEAFVFIILQIFALHAVLKIGEYLTIRPVALSGYGSIAHEAKPNGLLNHGP